ncbi:MAG: dihydrodipicolinate synthase family protein [Mesorhizobium sp.]|uniref:dihydrodipicolinate synthase family protein n=1 Tax=Mesorhizobium sp. TaxID=1871066 RepID=UPI000FE9A3D5|nr:dihydrodipicolinate synthase family protein [Mesorhizobium sp.]RWQ35164.1 MAG: dihydrodipicolinate synthase family protein [Mesorhizobium sp.]TIL27007.1 MAG: dihydrodipicolinate synthase family protein [Mesorhizobium sp.]
MTHWQGVFPAVTTKLDQDGSINLEATQASINRLIDNGVSGIIVLPMLGENASLLPQEKEAVIRAAREAVAGRVPLLSGLAEISTAGAAASARKFQDYGAEGLMVFPSLGYKTDPRETAEWYKAIAGASDLPIMIYNNPIAYGVDVTPAILKVLADCPTIMAVKEETGDVRRVTDMFIALGNRFDIFCGVDDQIVESMSLGATGWVSGMTNAWPKECVEIFNLCASGNFAGARDLYRIMTPSFHLDTHVKLVQYIKMAEHLVYGAPEWTRAPRLPLAGEERERVVATIKATIEQLKQAQSRRAA